MRALIEYVNGGVVVRLTPESDADKELIRAHHENPAGVMPCLTYGARPDRYDFALGVIQKK